MMFASFLFTLQMFQWLVSCQRPLEYIFSFQSVDRQVEQRMPKSRLSDATVDLEMRFRPTQCLLCGTYFHLPHLTNRVALLLSSIQHVFV